MLLFVALHLLALLALAATAFVTGRTLLPAARFPDPWERAAVALPLGLAVLANLALLLGFCGRLRAGWLVALLAAVHLGGLPAWRELLAALRRGLGRTVAFARRAPRRALLVGLLALAAVAPFALLPLYPPTAFDATLYHLPFARAFATSGGVAFQPQLRMPIFPQVVEVLFAALLVLRDDLLAQGAMALATVATAGLLAVWGRRGFAPWAGLLAAAVFLGSPLVAYLSGAAYIDPGLALYTTAALYAVARYRGTEERGWLVLAAAFAATAADAKYLGLFFAFALAPVVLVSARPRRRLRDLLLYAAVAAAVLAPWYGRIVAATGNPLFPFAARYFGKSEWTPLPSTSADDAVLGLTELPAATERWLRALLHLPGAHTLGGRPPLSPVFLLVLPLAAAAAWREPRLRRALLAVAAYAVAVWRLPPDVRYLMPALPIASLVAGECLARALAGRRRSVALLLAAACFFPGWLYAAYRLHRQGAPPVDAAGRLRYVERQLPGAAAVHFLNRTAGDRYTVYALHAENLVYVADGTLLGDWSVPASFWKVDPLLGDPAALHRTLRGFGAQYLLVPRQLAGPLPLASPAFRERLRPVYEDAQTDVFALASP